MPPGTYWQWQLQVVDACGIVSTVYTSDLRNTTNHADRPCCLPGWEKDVRFPHGECIPDDDGKLVRLC